MRRGERGRRHRAWHGGIGDQLGPGVVAAVIAAVVLLGALIGDMAREPWQLVSAVLLVLVLVAAVALVAARLLQPIRALTGTSTGPRPRRCPP